MCLVLVRFGNCRDVQGYLIQSLLACQINLQVRLIAIILNGKSPWVHLIVLSIDDLSLLYKIVIVSWIVEGPFVQLLSNVVFNVDFALYFLESVTVPLRPILFSWWYFDIQFLIDLLLILKHLIIIIIYLQLEEPFRISPQYSHWFLQLIANFVRRLFKSLNRTLSSEITFRIIFHLDAILAVLSLENAPLLIRIHIWTHSRLLRMRLVPQFFNISRLLRSISLHYRKDALTRIPVFKSSLFVFFWNSLWDIFQNCRRELSC